MDSMKLSAVLREMSRRSQVHPNSMILHELADRAVKLERNMYDDVTEFHKKFGHPAPAAPDDITKESVLAFRTCLIQEEARELCEAIKSRNLSAVALEAVDLIYVVIGTLVTLGLPLLPFWRAVHSANMTKRENFAGGKPLKPDGWKKPNGRAILFHYKQGLK